VSIEPVDLQSEGACILLAEDDPVLREVTRELLEHMGYRVVIACNGLEAISQYKKYRSNIILAVFDVMMPYLNGPEAAEKICVFDASLPFIFVTGYDSEQVLDKIKIPQGFQILRKPVNFDHFCSAIKQAIASKEA